MKRPTALQQTTSIILIALLLTPLAGLHALAADTPKSATDSVPVAAGPS